MQHTIDDVRPRSRRAMPTACAEHAGRILTPEGTFGFTALEEGVFVERLGGEIPTYELVGLHDWVALTDALLCGAQRVATPSGELSIGRDALGGFGLRTPGGADAAGPAAHETLSYDAWVRLMQLLGEGPAERFDIAARWAR